MGYFKAGHVIKLLTTQATAGGTTALTVSSKQGQVFTGILSETVVLPDATTLKKPRRFDISNDSTQDITVNANGGSFVATVPSGSQRFFILTDNSTSTGVWRVGGVLPSSLSSTVSALDKLNLLSGLAGLNITTDNIQSKTLKLNQEEQGGNFWRTKTPSVAQGDTCAQMSFGGFLYTVGSMGSLINGSSSTNVTNRFNDDTNSWLLRAVYPVTVFGNAATAAGGFGYSFGGLNQAQTSNREGYKYSDISDSWSVIATATLALSKQSVGYDESYIYLVGGQLFGGSPAASNAYVYSYDQTTNVYSAVPVTTSGSGRRGAGGVVVNKKMLFIGGRDASDTYQANTDIIDFMVRGVLTGPAISQAKTFMGSSVALGVPYIFGGTNNSSTSVNVVERLDPALGIWLSVMPMLTARRLLNGSGHLNGSVYNVAGVTESANTLQSMVESYIPFCIFNMGSFMIKTSTPTSVLLSALANEFVSNLPVQIRTDGDNWKNFISGSDSVLKTGETLEGKFTPHGSGTLIGGDNSADLNTTETYNKLRDLWASRQTLAVAVSRSAGFKANGYGFSSGGNAGITTNTQFDDITNAYATRTPITTGVQYGHPWSINNLGYVVSGASTSPSTLINNNQQYNQTTNAWLQKTVTPSPRKTGASFEIGTVGYILGGDISGNGSSLANAGHAYESITDSWSAITATMPSVIENTIGISAIGYGHALGGDDGSSNLQNNYRYDPTLNSWSSKASQLGIQTTSQAFRMDEFIYNAGGSNGGGNIATVREYNTYSNVWASKTSMTAARRFSATSNPGVYRNYELRVGIPAFYSGFNSFAWLNTAFLVEPSEAIGGMNISGVYVFRGYSRRGAGGATPIGYRYSPEKNVWTSYIPRSSTLHHSGDFVLNSLGYSCGGGSGSSLVEAIDVVTDSNITITSLTTATGASMNGRYSSYGYVIGGNNGGNLTNNQRYSDTTKTWAAKQPLVTARSYGKMSLSDYLLVIAGGEIPAGTNTVVGYNETTDAWSNLQSMTSVRDNTPWGLSIDKSSWVGGGSDAGGTNIKTVEYYNPTLNIWLPAISMTSERSYVGQVGIGNSSGLTIGGSNPANTASLSTVEILQPTLRNAILGLALEVK